MSNNQEKLNEQLVKVVLDTKTCDEVRIKRVKYLIRLGADKNARYDDGKSVLVLARDSNDECMIELLESLGAKEGEVPSKKGYEFGKQIWNDRGGLVGVDEIKDLVKKGANLNVRDKYGNTPLVHAAIFGDKENVKTLLELGADVEVRGQYGYSALIRAAQYGLYGDSIVKMLIDSGADVNAKSDIGNTALILASYNGYLDVVNLLLENGGDPYLKNKEGVEAFISASSGRRPLVVARLKEFKEKNKNPLNCNVCSFLGNSRG